jgi:hypothetical protein
MSFFENTICKIKQLFRKEVQPTVSWTGKYYLFCDYYHFSDIRIFQLAYSILYKEVLHYIREKYMLQMFAIVQALRVNPYKYNIIFDNTKYDDSSKYHEGLLKVANSFMKILSRQMVDKTMIVAAAMKEE